MTPERAAQCLFALLFALSLCPVLLVPIPAMVDYPNHLARMFILSRDSTALAQPYYQVAWAVYPNLAMDLVVPRLAHFMSVEAATRIFYVLSQTLIVSGAIAIEYAVKGRFHIAGVVAVMLLYSLPFAWGFVNFEFGLGLALWGIACSLTLLERPWPARAAMHAAFTALLFFAHFFALGIYGATIGFCELWRAWSKTARPLETLARLALLATPAATLLGVMAFSGGAIGGSGTKWFAEAKPLWLFFVLSGYSPLLSGLSVTALLGVLYALNKHAALRLHGAGMWLAVGFAALFVAMPSQLFRTSFVDVRVIVAAALIVPAFMSISFPNRPWRWATVCCVTAITLANVLVVFSVWTSYRAEYDAMVKSFSRIDKASLVLVAHSGDAADPPWRDLREYPIYHAPTLAVHYADAFVPSFYTSEGKQPVRVRLAYQRLDLPFVGVPPVILLKAIAEHAATAGVPAIIQAWLRDFDYLYIVGPPIPNPMPSLLEELYAGTRFVLYRIHKRP